MTIIASTQDPACPTIMSDPPAYDLTHLDTLLTTYLHLLDTYTQQRNALSTHLSSGFFSLAQAQRSSMLPPGQRYGQEMYDQRMKAARRLRVQVGSAAEEGGAVGFELYEQVEGEERPTSKSHTEKTSSPGKPGGSPEESQNAPHPDPGTASPGIEQQPNKPAKAGKSKNPLHQFGLLTPPPLRTSQTAFTSALSTIPTLVNTSRAMGELEEEIERVRVSLGLNTATEGALVDDKKIEAEAVVEEKADGKTLRPTSPKRRSLTSRSKMSEPRSRVLKLGV